ncbi:MAG: hypothetical protein ACTSPD_18990 [Promethearchaeota archaeon]
MNEKNSKFRVPNGISPELWHLLDDHSKFGIFGAPSSRVPPLVNISPKSRKIWLARWVLKNKNGREQAEEYIHEFAFHDWQKEVLRYILHEIHDPFPDENGNYAKADPVTFDEIQNYYEELTGDKFSDVVDGTNTTSTTTSTITRSKPKTPSINDVISNHKSRSSKYLLPYLIQGIEGGSNGNEILDDEGVVDVEQDGISAKLASLGFDPSDFHVSTKKRNHNGLFTAKIGEGTGLEDIFNKIVQYHEEKGLLKWGSNSMATLIFKKMNRGYVFRLSKKGSVIIHISKLNSFDWAVYCMKEDFSFLSHADFNRLINAIIPERGHFANGINPQDKVEAFLKDNMVRISVRGNRVAEAVVDRSVGVYELELKGNFFFCALLQEKISNGEKTKHLEQKIKIINQQLAEIKDMLNSPSEISILDKADILTALNTWVSYHKKAVKSCKSGETAKMKRIQLLSKQLERELNGIGRKC